MATLLRGFYRIFIKNRFIRWVWMLALSLWGVKWLSENYVEKKKSYYSKTILSIQPNDINTFTIRKGDEETIFTRADTGWLVVKNDITIRIPTDSIADFLNLFSKMESYSLKKIMETEIPTSSDGRPLDKPLYAVFITNNKNTTDSLSVFYTAEDSVSGYNLTYLRLSNEIVLHGIKEDLKGLFEKDFNSYRKNNLLKFSRANIEKVMLLSRRDTATFYAKDSVNWVYFNDKFVVSKDTFNNYLQSIQLLSGVKFYDAARDFTDHKNIENQLIIYTNQDSVTLTAYSREHKLILHSTQNNDNYFRVDSINHIFKSPLDFIQPKGKSRPPSKSTTKPVKAF